MLKLLSFFGTFFVTHRQTNGEKECRTYAMSQLKRKFEKQIFSSKVSLFFWTSLLFFATFFVTHPHTDRFTDRMQDIRAAMSQLKMFVVTFPKIYLGLVWRKNKNSSPHNCHWLMTSLFWQDHVTKNRIVITQRILAYFQQFGR